jgi:hypothetical protein
MRFLERLQKSLELKDVDFGLAPTEALKMYVILARHLVATAPDKESEDAVRLLAEQARSELEGRLRGPTGDPSSRSTGCDRR